MCEVLAALMILAVGRLKGFEAWEYMTYNMIVVATNFTVLMRCFTFYLRNKAFSKKFRFIAFSVMYLIMLCEVSLGLLYFKTASYSFVRADLIKALTGLSMLGLFLVMKSFDLKMSNDYGAAYLAHQIVDISLVLGMMVCNVCISGKLIKAYQFIPDIYIIVLILILIVRRTTAYKLEFWYHKRVLFTKFDILLAKGEIERAFDPLERKVSDDYILSECDFVMKKAFVRSSALNSITRTFMKKLQKTGFNRLITIRYTAMFAASLMTNLMKRDLDFAVMPTFVINPLQFIKRRYTKSHKANV